MKYGLVSCKSQMLLWLKQARNHGSKPKNILSPEEKNGIFEEAGEGMSIHFSFVYNYFLPLQAR